MGTSMASVSFRKPNETVWTQVKPRLVDWLDRTEGFTSNLETQGEGFAIVSPYGDGGPVLGQVVSQISKLVDGYAVFAICCDSDFCLLEVYHRGEALEKCYIGEVFEEYLEFGDYSVPNMDFWKSLLIDACNAEKLEEIFNEEYVFAEDFMRNLSSLIGMPVFDDKLVYEVE